MASEQNMTLKTHNHIYTLTDASDGGWLISGHPKYCPTPTLVELETAPVVGRRAVCIYLGNPPAGVAVGAKIPAFITTPITEIHP